MAMLGSTLCGSQAVMAGQTLSAEAAQALFADKTFNGRNEVKDREFMVYSAADGTHTLKKSNGKIKEAAWRINDEGHHCVAFSKERCSVVTEQGDGKYYKITNGTHTHTLWNFTDGNNL